MTVYLIRHGQTAGNLEHRYVGVTDEPLCAAGAQALLKCREYLPEMLFTGDGAMQGRVYTSPMLRCRQTARQLFPDIEPTVIEDFREMDFGEFEYKNYAELADDARYQAYIDSGGKLDFPAAETREHFCVRVAEAFRQCAAHIFASLEASVADGPEEPFIFCMHGGTMMAVLDAYSAPHRDYFDWQVPNASGFRAKLVLEKNGISLQNVKKLG